MNIISFYKINHFLSAGANISISEIESLMPWEREIYLLQHKMWLEEQEKKSNEKRKSTNKLY
jgi:hypothetical protein